jgi:hypothetical protein
MSRYLFTALNAASSTGPGPTLSFPVPTRLNASAQPIITGAPSDATVHREVTINGTDFILFSDLGNLSSASNTYISGIGTPLVMGYRLNLVSLSGGTSPTVTITMAIEEMPPAGV